MEDQLSQVPGDILDIIFSYCDLENIPRISLVCKKFYTRINTERMWKERSIELWKETTSHPISNLEWIKENVEILNWKKITKFLSTTKDRNYRHEWSWNRTYLYLQRFKRNQWIPSKSVRVYFRSERIECNDKCISYGHFLKDGNGHGVSLEFNGTYNGEWKDYSQHGQGIMTWLDGYKYEGEWIENRPKDWENCVHPKIVECLERGTCTREVSNEKRTLPQLLLWCPECFQSFCNYCSDHCHNCKSTEGTRGWIDWKYCGCRREECLQAVSYTHLTLPTT
eukprot:TRINITY_DN2120_c0_g5_i1.p1 TRINITY_DN2120_c0_g5~~TRINITY_DN2120_c0_g5_i1.p1  ORF type:complete len:281 (-),score=23.04 TRINITY_DN2120_c0_g5_i1:30-872(-)